MRAKLVLLTIVAALAAAGSASAASPKIAAFQLALAKRGYYRGPLDGVLGPYTRRATARFQRHRRLIVDGVPGPQTRGALGRWARPEIGRRIIRRGSVGWDVAELQFLLRRHGIFVPMTGVFGQVTATAVLGVQQAAGLKMDAIVGPHTLRAVLHRRARVARLTTQARVRATIIRWSNYYGVDPKLARSLAWIESGYQPGLTSKVGAWGVFQVMPATWRYVETVLAGRRYPRNVQGNVRVGLLYFRHLLRQFGSERRALAAWYTGPAYVRRHGISRQGRWFAETVLSLRARL